MKLRRNWIVRSLLSILLLAAPATYASDSAPARDSLAHRLAEIDEGRVLEPTSIEAFRAQAALIAADGICAADPTLVADQVVKASEILKERGVYSRPVDMLEGLQAIYSGSPEEVDCLQGLMQYLSTRQSVGFTHSQAVAAMRVLFNTLGGQ